MVHLSNTATASAQPLRRFRRIVGIALSLLACASVSQPRAASAQTPQVFSGTGTDIAATVAAFKAAIGGADNGLALGAQPSGYRQLTWDDFPDEWAWPNQPPSWNTQDPRMRGLSLERR